MRALFAVAWFMFAVWIMSVLSVTIDTFTGADEDKTYKDPERYTYKRRF